MHREILFDDGKHRWTVIGRDPSKKQSIIDTNEYLITDSGEGFLLDPGGAEIFPSVVAQISQELDIQKIVGFLCSHQDPDVMSSLPLWMATSPKARLYVSWLWTGFMSHFGKEYADRFTSIPDGGMTIQVGHQELRLVPAHFCHSSGNFHLYDPKAKCLFSGDVGAALIPPDYPFFVEDFKKHVEFMEAFHIRWMPSNEAKNNWVRRVRKLDVQMLCPQHGAIFRGKAVHDFLDWFEDLEVGVTRCD